MDKFEEYKLFVEDTARFTDRRQTVNNIYVAVNSIILGACRRSHYFPIFYSNCFHSFST